MMPPLIILLPLLLVGSVASTIAGGGLGILLTVVASMFLDIRTSVVLVGLLGFIIQLAKISHFRKDIQWQMVGWYVALGIPTSIVGAVLLFVLPERWVEVGLGTVCLIFVFMQMRRQKIRIPPTRTNLLLAGAGNGLLSGMIGNGVLLRSQALLAFGLTKEQFVGTSSLLAFILNLSRNTVYLQQFPWTQETVVLLLLSIPVVMIGVRLGRYILQFVSPNTFELLMSFVIVAGAIKLLFFPS
ncbi:hypothetical protein A2881_03380 [Candidatus Peribacteria bacterium RIFCSPHIGHO2_01_FULL_55_13]|nr:MAG: hypothetical protein A2881_03380 [Candidatus Peribacteria bacterium RIFCSPHIGHO2_01_FULL_55_13]OGJ66415.1 MAG: hypothetical protein A3F36_05050 [Candidatus Peribacteria bacterium RIFCSPHIGHO2_12_FULL_55_11]